MIYNINKEKNRISELNKMTFSELGLREREHLQEWIANNPNSLGEELLIIQKEFNGFSETNERLDLLALDKLGNLVIIENKLDDSGKDVTWQAIKYASYCSSLTSQEILEIYQKFLGTKADAKEMLSEFFERDISEIVLNQGSNSQRLILVAANFRKEVTSTVLWMMNFKIRIQCIKVTPYKFGESIFLNVEQILPTKDTENFAISLATKAQEEIQVQESTKNRNILRRKFWDQFINASNQANQLFINTSPTESLWISKGIGMTGVSMELAISNTRCKSEILFSCGNKEKNKQLFDFVFANKKEIENLFGSQLIWECNENKVMCRIKSQLDGVNYFDESDWKKINEFLIDSSVRMEKSFKDIIKKMNNHFKNK